MINWKNLSFLGVAAVIILADYLVVLTDCIIAGRVLGEAELGAMNYLMPAFSFVTFCAWLVASGFTCARVRALRRGREVDAARLAGCGLICSVLVGFLLVLTLYWLEEPYLAFMDPDAETRALASAYWDYFPAVVILQSVFIYLLYLSYASGHQRTCISAYLTLFIVNVIVSHAFGSRYGMVGLSVGTLVAALVALAPFMLLIKRRALEFRFSPPVEPLVIGRLFADAFANSAILLFHAALFVGLTKYVIARWGAESLPVLAVVFCIIRLTLFFGSAGVAVELSGSRVRELRLVAPALFAALAVVTALFLTAPELIVGLFGIEDPELVEGSKYAARITVGSLAVCAALAVVQLRRRMRRSSVREAPVNYLQQYALDRLNANADSQMFNLAMLFKLRKGVDPARLAQALVTAACGHAAFRSVFRRDPVGVVVQREELKSEDITCPLERISESELLSKKGALVKDFKVLGGKLFDAKMFVCGESAYLLSNFHHLICDGYSFPLLLEDARKAYHGESFETGDYYEVLAKRNERSQSSVAESTRQAFCAILADERFVTLPQPDRTDVPGYGVHESELSLPADFEAFLAARRVTRHHVFLAATVLALRELTGANDLLIDWVFHGRISREEMKTVGPFMLDLPLIAEDVDKMTPSDMLAIVKQATFRGIKSAAAFRNVSDLNPTGRDRLTFNHQDAWSELMCAGPVDPTGPYGWMFEETIPLVSSNARAENPFNVEIMERRDSTRLFIEYDSGRYSPELVRRYADCYRQALGFILNDKA